MSMLVGTRRALLGPRRLRYLLRATFNAPDQGYADAQVLDTHAEGIQDGTLTVVEVDGTLAIVSNQLAFTAQATPVWGDLGAPSQAITRALGRALLTGFNLSTWEEMGIAWHSAAAVVDPDNAKHAWQANATDGQLDNQGGAAIWTGLATSTDYRLALVLGGFDASENPYYAGQSKATYVYGCWYFLHDGVQWHLAWLDTIDNTATLYAMISNLDAVGTLTLVGSGAFRVPDKDLSAIQVPAAYSSFTAPNGTSLDAITPEVGGAWTEQVGDWDIQGNKANLVTAGAGDWTATSDSGVADVIVDCAIAQGVPANGAYAGINLRYADATHYWLIGADDNGLFIFEQDAGYTQRASTAVVVNAGQTYTLRVIADDDDIDAFWDGSNKTAYGSATLNKTVTKQGIHLSGTDTAATWDTFTVYPRTSAQYDAVLGGV